VAGKRHALHGGRNGVDVPEVDHVWDSRGTGSLAARTVEEVIIS
jgi:hypothetical protein